MNQQNTGEDQVTTKPLVDLPVTEEQAEETKAGDSFNSFGGFTGGTFLGGSRGI